MLKLKKIQILGFKSFSDKTELTLPGEGIAAIVGPNGCGKSNILDGVTWVLGEQSAKSLRGGEMKDVIFAGTRDRRPLGMAEVTITLVDPAVYEKEPDVEPPAPDGADWDENAARAARASEAEQMIGESQPGQSFEAEGEGDTVVLKVRRRKFHRAARRGEMIVTRRLFRTGESEYLLNGKLCRLADIRDIFMGTGLGPESYAIIGQERIGQLLSSRPHDRRAIIEEAAGITRYKTRKRLAELKLEQAKQNLARVEDIFEEVAKQLVSLKRQAAKAERYGAMRDEFRARLRIALGSRLHAMDGEHGHILEQMSTLSWEIEAQAAEHDALTAALADSQARGYAIDMEAKEQSRAASEAALELERARSKQARNRDRLGELATRGAQQAAELRELRDRLERLGVERTEQSAFWKEAGEQAARSRAEGQQKQTEAREASAAVGAAESRLEAARREATQLLDRVADARREQAQAEEALAGLDRDTGRLGGEFATARGELEALGAARAGVAERHTAAIAALKQAEAALAAARTETASKRAAEAEAKRRGDLLRSERAQLSGRRSSLENLLREHSYSTDTVKKLLRANSLAGGLKPVGTLADFLEVGDRFEAVVDEFLRDELNYIVVKSWDAADEGMRLLKSGVDGRATFLVHPEDSQARLSFAADENAAAPPREGVVQLKDCVRVLNGFGKSLEVVLPKLRDGFVTPDVETARTLALENPDGFFLAPSGECFHNVTVTGGKPRAEGPLALKRELRDAGAKLAGVEEQLARAEADVADLARTLAALAQAADAQSEQRREAERAAAHESAALWQMDGEQQRLERRLADYAAQEQRARDQRTAKEELIGRKRGEVAQLRQAQAGLEGKQKELEAAVGQARAARDQTTSAAAANAAELAGLEERRRAAETTYRRTEQLWAEGERRRASLEGQIASAEAERGQYEEENQSLAGRESELAARREAADSRATALAEESQKLRERARDLDASAKAVRSSLDRARDQRATHTAAFARLVAEIAHIGELAVQDLGLEADALRAQLAAGEWVPLAPEPLRAEEEACRELKQRMEAIGPVNMMALDEYKEAETRHTFLAEQRKDLQDSIEDIHTTVRELDGISQTKFEEAFARINEHFNTVFARLFGGGQASMRLTDEENQGDSGVDIVAQPPGKKLQNIFLLSGGEKALTALSLLMGIFMHQPAPFCVLDEVDAPLDETNVGRLAEMLRSMAEDTQFVLVTHSKRMMAAADMIYGVTMQELGVSKLVSVRLGSKSRTAQRELALA